MNFFRRGVIGLGNMSFKIRLSLSFLFLLVLLGITGAAGLFSVNIIRKNIGTLTEVASPLYVTTTKLIDELEETSVILSQILLLRDEDEVKEKTKILASVQDKLLESTDQLEKIIAAGDVQLDMQPVSQAQEEYFKKANEVSEVYKKVLEKEFELNQLRHNLEEQKTNLDEVLDDVIDMAGAAVAKKEDRGKTLVQSGDATVEDMDQLLSELYSYDYFRLTRGIQLRSYIKDMQGIIEVSLAREDIAEVVGYRKGFEDISKTSRGVLKQLKPRLRTEKEKQFHQAIEDGFEKYTNTVLGEKGIFAIHDELLDLGHSIIRTQKKLAGIRDNFNLVLSDVSRVVDSINKKAENETKSGVLEARRNIGLLIAIGVIIGALMALFMGRALLIPIRKIIEIGGAVAKEGDLSKMVDIKGIKLAAEEEEEEAKTRDEIRLLAISFNRLIRSMRSLAAQAKAIADDDLKNEALDKKIKGDLGEAFSAMVENLKGLSKQAESIAKDELDTPELKEEAKGVLGSSFARMVKFLRGVAKKTTIIAKGDLTPTIETKGTLSDAFNEMIKSLRSLAQRTKQAGTQIITSSSQILTASQQQATGIEEEATQIGQTATSAKQLAITSRQVTELSNEIDKSSASSVHMATSGSQAVDNVIKGIESITQSVLATAKKIEGLGEKSQAITEIITLIEDIANQTNILSLNAAIEAARAGEAGKGFAVVADAIGKLADRTTKSTKDISDLIKGIQQDTSSCVISMEDSTKETEKGTALSLEAGRSLKEIVGAFEHVAQSAKEISLASQQQASGSEQISKAMGGIDQIMKQSSAGAKQSTESAKELSALAEELKKAVGQFKLGEEEHGKEI